MPEEQPALYDRLGGAAAIDRWVDALYERVLVDPELAPFFQNVALDKVRMMQKEFFAVALGGPMQYSGVAIARAHAGRGITAYHFAKFADHLLNALHEHGLSETDVSEVIRRLSMHRNDVTGESY